MSKTNHTSQEYGQTSGSERNKPGLFAGLFRKKPPVYELNLIPKPYSYQPAPGYFLINRNTLLIVDPKRQELAEWFRSMFQKAFGHTLYVHYNKPGYNNILFEENAALDIEGYVIECRPDCLKISAGGDPGFFYALQSVRQILKVETLLYEDTIAFPCMVLQDFPKYRYRGFMLDTARHFFDRTDIKRYLEIMSALKFNVFHWHLSDDQGFRFEIKKHQFVNMTASERNGDRVGRDGSASPYIDKKYKGYYTKEDVREILDYARERYITVVPEIDMPGHVQALLAAYPWLSCVGESVPVMTDYGVSRYSLCVGKESTYAFMRDILDEVMDAFDGPYIHLGCDEVVQKAWKDCPHCKKLAEENKLPDTASLQTYFLNRMTEHCKSRGRTVVAWNDGLKDGADADVISQYWLDDENHTNSVAAQAAAGRKVILSPVGSFYCDYPYASLPLSKTFFYQPPLSLSGEEISKNILGIEAPLWTEYVLSRDKADLNCFPRLLAVAEQSWTRRVYPNEEKGCKRKRKKLKLARFNRFLSRVSALEPMLDVFRINYAEQTVAEPKDKKYKKAEIEKWNYSDQYSELRTNKTLKEAKKQRLILERREEKERMGQALERAVDTAAITPIKNIVIEEAYDKKLI